MIKKFVCYIQFNNIFPVLTTSLFETTPQYVIIALIVLIFIIVIGLFGTVFYYIYRKHNSIDNHTNKKYQKDNDNKEPDTYKIDRESYKKDVSDLGAKILPDGQTIVNMAAKIIGLKEKK